jgi:hypothetical protein
MTNATRLAALGCACALVLGACTDRSATGDPTGPGAGAAPPALAAGGQGNGRSSLDIIEDDYAAGALDRENANRYRQYAVSAPEKLPSKYRSGAKGKDATYSMVQLAREWDRLSAKTQQEILDIRKNGTANLDDSLLTTHFVLHYTRAGNHAVPAQDADGNGTPDFIDAAARSWEEVWTREVEQLGYPQPKGTGAQPFHVYYWDMAYYGYAMPENVELTDPSVPSGTASAYIYVENDFYGFPPNDEDVTGREVVRTGALKVTQAHEFMHALQFALNVYQSGWLMESHATWAEDAVYDGLNDWHWYINRFVSTPELPIFNRYVYGSAFFQHWLSETYGVDVPRRIWEAARSMSAADAVRTVAFGGSWEPMQAFAPAQYLLQISDFTRDAASVIPDPTRLYVREIVTTYPAGAAVPASTNSRPNRAPSGLGANYVDFQATRAGTLTVAFDGADGSAWRAHLILTPARGGAPTVQPLALDGGSAATAAVDQFGTRWAKVTLSVSIADREGVDVPFSYSAAVQ